LSKVIKNTSSPIIRDPIRLTLKTIEQKVEEPKEEDINYEQLILDAQNKAQEIIQEAEKEKEKIMATLEEARQNLELERVKVMEEAKEQGFNEGYKAGKQDGYSEFEAKINSAKEIIQLTKDEFEKKIDSANEVILTIAMKVAEKILVKELSKNENDYLNIVQEAIDEVKEYPEVKIYVPPSQYDLVRKNKEEFQELFTMNVELYVIPDHHLEPYGVQVESSSGKIDASITTQVEQLKMRLLDFIRED